MRAPAAIKPGQCRRPGASGRPDAERDVAAVRGQCEEGQRGASLPHSSHEVLLTHYCAGAGAGVAGAGSVGFGAAGVAGFIGCSAAGGLVLWVVVLSVPLLLQAATPSRAKAETDARMSFFIISLLQYAFTLR